ncbi:MAG: TolC family protein [Parvularculaceae bacterium]|nr:TolC family protein [Parvularculaceae bacterium]
MAQAWFGLIEARQQRELGERDTAARESNLRVTERRYERGVASSLDVRLSRSALGSSRANLALRQQAEKEAARRLEVLLGRYPAAELAAASSLPALTALAGAGAPGEILARRPDLRAAEARMEAAGLRARATRKQMLPRLTLSSQISTSGPDLADVIDPERLAGNIASGLFQPLFQGGRLLANSKRARALAEASLLNYAQTALNAYEEAENAISAETYLALREEALKLAYEEAAAAEELTERRYASGAATIFDLLNAQTRRISSESAFLSARQQRVSNRVLLYLAIGGDFLVEPDVTPEARTQ